MVETMVSIVIFLGVMFVVCKVLGAIARFCSMDEMVAIIGDSLSARSGDFSSHRKN